MGMVLRSKEMMTLAKAVVCNLNKFIGLVITTGIVMIINYVVNKLWVFSK